MKSIFIITLSILLFHNLAKGQQTSDCPFLKSTTFNVYIPEYYDTTQANGLKARVINVIALTNGFKLLSDDSLVRVRSFNLVFDDKNGVLYSKKSDGDKMTDNQSELIQLSKLKDATLITIDNIKIEYKGLCYTIPGQLYYSK